MDEEIQSVQHGEGRLVATYNETAIESIRAEYWRQDHLGNTRVAFSDFNLDGVIATKDDPNTTENEVEITQENHYYPFGLNHDGPLYQLVQPENKYQYNGKEYVEDLGLDWNDYGVRWYNSAIGRWHTIDPLADKYSSWSSYCYVMDMPINAIDPDGRYVEIKNEDDQKYFLEKLKSVLGNTSSLFSFKKNGILKVDKKGLKQLKEGDSKEIVQGFYDLANSTDYGIEFSTQLGEDGKYTWNPSVMVDTKERDENGNIVTTSMQINAFSGKGITLDLTNKNEGIFTSLKNVDDNRINDNRSLILMNRQLSETGTFSSNGEKTSPCAGCILVHEFLDHGLPWIKGTNSNVVEYHNKALRIKKSKQRDGKDH